ncbi:hypothetical protein GcC1_024043, partial [Golovinomyces cichoracearum]
IIDAELYAILKSLNFVAACDPQASCYVFSDSQAAIARIPNSINFNSYKIRSMALQLTIQVHWCQSHVGIE